jgi:hypothetical protein
VTLRCYAERVRFLSVVAIAILFVGCKTNPEKKRTSSERANDSLEVVPPERDVWEPSPAPMKDATDEASKLVYVVTIDNRMFSFDPRIPGTDAYRFVGRLRCPDRDPQSMAVDRHGSAWVFYNTARLYRVSLADASCSPTPYAHPSNLVQLGMGFTAVAQGSSDERLFVINRDMGLTEVNTTSYRAGLSGTHRRRRREALHIRCVGWPALRGRPKHARDSADAHLHPKERVRLGVRALRREVLCVHGELR